MQEEYVQDIPRKCPEEQIEVANNHMKRHSASPVVREYRSRQDSILSPPAQQTLRGSKEQILSGYWISRFIMI